MFSLVFNEEKTDTLYLLGSEKSKMKNKVGVEVVALGVTELFRIVAHETGRQCEYTVLYETGPDGNRELLCTLGGEVCFGEGSCIAPIADLKRIKEALAEHFQIPVAELLKTTREEAEEEVKEK